jgi:hypothetical protein
MAKDPKTAPSVREEVEERPGSVHSCPQIVDEIDKILVSQEDHEAAKLSDKALPFLGAAKDEPHNASRSRIALSPI